MASSNLTANSSLGILDLADARLVDCLTDMENLDCSTRFMKTIERLHKTGNEKLADLTANLEVDVSSCFQLGDDATTEGEDVSSRLDSILFKPSTDLTQTRDLTCYSTYQSASTKKGEKAGCSRLDSILFKPSTDLTRSRDLMRYNTNQSAPEEKGEDVEWSRLDSILFKPYTDLTQSRDLTGYSTYQSTPKEKGEDSEWSRPDSILFKPSTDLTQSRDLTGCYSTYQSTPKEKFRQSFSTNPRPIDIPSFGRASTAAAGNDSELSAIPKESFSTAECYLQDIKQSSRRELSRKENKPPQERSIENGRKASSSDWDIAGPSYHKELCRRSCSQDSFTELRKKFELNSDGSSSGSTLKLLKSPPVRRSLSLDDGNPLEFDRRNTGFSALSINSSMFRTGADAINAIDEDEHEFREENRFEISRISNVSTIPPDFSHVSDPASGDYFFARSEKVGGLSHQENSDRPSLGLEIVSPPANPLGDAISRQAPEESIFGLNSRPSNEPRQQTSTSQTSATTVQCRLRNGTVSSDGTITSSQTVEQPSTGSGYQSSQQPLHVYVPMQDRISPCCYSGHVFQYPPAHPWGDQGPSSCPQLYQNSVCRGPCPNVPSIYNQPAMARDFFKIMVQAVLPEQIVCVHDFKEVDLVLHNPSYQTFRCHVRVMHVTVLDSIGVKLDAMTNSEFVTPGTVEVRGGSTHNLKLRYSFKLAGKYRVHLEVISESMQAAASSSMSTFTVEVEEPNVEMTSTSNGSNCIDFGLVRNNNPPTPLYVHLVNNTRVSVPMKISINSMCDIPQKFLFPIDTLAQLVATTSHTWVDVFPTFIVLRLEGQSTLDLPVVVDSCHQPNTSQGEKIVASVQLSLKGDSYRTKKLMKICATFCASTSAVNSTAQPKPVPGLFPGRDETSSDGSRRSERAISFLATRKRSLYFPGVQLGQSLEKTITLMNRSHDTKLLAQLSLISSSPQPQYFIRDGNKEYSRLQNITFEPQQKKDFEIVFRPNSVASSASSLQVKACIATRRMEKQDFLVPVCGYGGASKVTMIRPNPTSSGKAHLLVNPTNKGQSEHSVQLRNNGSRAAFVAILPLKDGQIELDHRVTLSNQAFVILPGETTVVKVMVTFSSFDSSIFTFSQYLSFLYGDEQLRKILKNKISSCDTSDRRLYEGPGLMKALDIIQSFHGEEAVPQDELYQEFKKEVSEIFYETIKVYDVILSPNVDVSDDQDDSFFTVSNLACSYGSLLNSTVFNRNNSQVAYGMSPPIRDIPKKSK